MAKDKETKQELPTGNAVLISCSNEQGRARAGLRFNQHPVLVDLATLTDAQRASLIDDPQLIIRPAPPEALTDAAQ